MGREYSRLLGVVRSLTSGQWTVEKGSGRAVISCARCGEYSVVPNHVASDGTAAGMWRCPCCPEIAFIKLCDFGEDYIP